MSAEVKWPGFVSFGSMPYDDVYLEDGSSEEDEEEGNPVPSDSRKPLMRPQKPARVTTRQPPPTVGVHPLIKKRFLRWFYVALMLLFIGVMVFVLLRITRDAMLMPGSAVAPERKFPTSSVHASQAPRNQTVLPCSHFDVQDVWVQNYPKLVTETAFRLVDVNKDGVLDVIMGFTTGVTSQFADEYLVCDVYFNGTWPCFGGMLALDGRTGLQLWRHYSSHEIFAVNCNVDVDRDGVNDCLGGGRAGIFELLSGATGHTIWKFQNKELLVSISNFYTPQFIRDVDGDGVQDVVNIHGGDPLRKRGYNVSHIGIVLVLSGATGHVITWMAVPDHQESYFSPQVYFQHGGREMVLFGSGGETKGGSLWVIPLADLLQGDDSKITPIYTDSVKGVMTPPALVDLSGDGVVDIVLAMFNSTIVAFDGQTYVQLWRYSIPNSESYSTPGVAYYNDDDVPDFMVVYNHGPGYPVYYYSQVTILDGRNGQPLLHSPVRTAGSSYVSPLAVSMEGHGGDAFIYFILDCLGHETETSSFKFADDGDDPRIGHLSRSDFCKQRFNTRDYSRFLILNRHLTMPGEEIYNSLDREAEEYQFKVNSSRLALAYLEKHPRVLAQVKELALGMGHDHEQSGSPHSEHRGDQHADGRFHSGVRGGGGGSSADADGIQGLAADDEVDKPTADRFAPRLGFDDEDVAPFFDPAGDALTPDDQPNQPPDPVDSYERERLQRPESQDADPFEFDPPDVYPENPPQSVVAKRPLGSAPVPEEPDDGQSDRLLNELLAKLLREEQFGDLDEPQVHTGRGYPSNKGSLPQSSPREGLSKWPYRSSQRNDQRKNFDGLYDRDGDTDRRQPPDRYENRQGRVDGPGPFGVYDDVDREEAKELLDNLYELSSPGAKRGFRTRRQAADEMPRRHRKRPLHSLDYLINELFLKLESRDKESPGSERSQRLADRDRRSANQGRRKARHEGPHDAGGIQRLISTGTLAPVLLGSEETDEHSIDVIFATYWFYPSDTQIILPEQQKCIKELIDKEAQRMDPQNQFYGLDHDAYEHMANDKCTKGSDAKQKAEYVSRLEPLDIYPFNLHTGELTVYRLRLTCRCEATSEHQRCAKVLPYDDQRWAGYMGTYGNGHFRPK